MKKKITIRCYGPVAVGKQYESPWEDVWIYWKGKPGKKKYCIALCLHSKTSLEKDHEINLELEKDHPGEWKDEIQQTEKALETINKGEYYIDDLKDDLGGEIPNIYSPKEWLNREEAERMLSFILKLKGINNPKFIWRKPKIIVIPM